MPQIAAPTNVPPVARLRLRAANSRPACFAIATGRFASDSPPSSRAATGTAASIWNLSDEWLLTVFFALLHAAADQRLEAHDEENVAAALSRRTLKAFQPRST